MREVVADAAGRYAMPLLPIGSYTVTATMSGFQTQERSKVVLEVQAVADPRLHRSTIAGVTTEVTVTEPGGDRCSCSAAMRRSVS